MNHPGVQTTSSDGYGGSLLPCRESTAHLPDVLRCDDGACCVWRCTGHLVGARGRSGTVRHPAALVDGKWGLSSSSLGYAYAVGRREEGGPEVRRPSIQKGGFLASLPVYIGEKAHDHVGR